VERDATGRHGTIDEDEDDNEDEDENENDLARASPPRGRDARRRR